MKKFVAFVVAAITIFMVIAATTATTNIEEVSKFEWDLSEEDYISFDFIREDWVGFNLCAVERVDNDNVKVTTMFFEEVEDYGCNDWNFFVIGTPSAEETVIIPIADYLQ